MKRHILFINENREDLLFFVDAFKSLPHIDGFKCTYASTPSQALEMLKYLTPDYIIFDSRMKQFNSLEFLTMVKDNHRLHESKTYLYSEKISEDMYDLMLAKGATGWIEKTNSIDRLTTRLQFMISARFRAAI